MYQRNINQHEPKKRLVRGDMRAEQATGREDSVLLRTGRGLGGRDAGEVAEPTELGGCGDRLGEGEAADGHTVLRIQGLAVRGRALARLGGDTVLVVERVRRHVPVQGRGARRERRA